MPSLKRTDDRHGLAGFDAALVRGAAIGLRNAQLLGMCGGWGAVEEAAVNAGGGDAVAADCAGVVRPGEGTMTASPSLSVVT